MLRCERMTKDGDLAVTEEAYMASGQSMDAMTSAATAERVITFTERLSKYGIIQC